MTEIIFAAEDGMYALTPDGKRLVSGMTHFATLPKGDWVMQAFGGKFIVMADRSGKNMPFVAYDDKVEQVNINRIEVEAASK